MPECFFVSDVHGHTDRYQKLFRVVEQEQPAALFLGGDLFPSGGSSVGSSQPAYQSFLRDYLAREFQLLQNKLGDTYPRVFLILGNDDGKADEEAMIEFVQAGLWDYVHEKRVDFGEYSVYGYAYVPPSPFLLKDWERYDVSRYVDPGCIPPEQGWHTVEQPVNLIKYATIENDLAELAGEDDLSNAIFLFHAPPYKTNLDRAGLDGRIIDHVQVDVHVGSIAIQRFIKQRQPLLSLHGHIHESARLTGSWEDQIGSTRMFSAAHDGPELALVRFDPANPAVASRELI